METSVSGQQSTALLLDKSTLFSTNGGNVIVVTMDQQQPWFTPSDDCDLQRAIEIAEGVESPSGFMPPMSSNQLLPSSVTNPTNEMALSKTTNNQQQWIPVCPTIRLVLHPEDIPKVVVHSQVDYMHFLVPDLMQITNCSFYWGKMDRYEAERLLDNKPEGTFLLRDSAQEEFLFSVSFRKYCRSLHARIEQCNNKFSFDCHDRNVYTSKTVTGLLEHYKDPSCVMFFEPALTLPLNRNFVFSLQQLCRATIVSHTTYDGIDTICLPKKLKSYLKEYHYKQRVRETRFDESIYSTA